MTEESKKLVKASLGISDPLDHLSPRAQKIAQQKVLTSLTDQQLKERHGLTTRKYNQIIRDDHFQAYMKQLQKTAGNDEFVEQMRKQEQHLYAKIFDEVLSRFDTPDLERDLGPNATVEERADYMKRFAHHANFSEMMRVFDSADKRARLSTGNATEITKDNNIRDVLQDRYQEVMAAERRRQAAMEKVSAEIVMSQTVDGTFIENDAGGSPETDDDAEHNDAIFEEYSITRSDK